MNRKQRNVIEWCVRSLEQEPDAWVFDEYQGVHKPTGTTVWIANSYYGMAVYADARRSGPGIGGVDGWGSLLGPLVPWRRRLRHAALKAKFFDEVPIEDVILANIEGRYQ